MHYSIFNFQIKLRYGAIVNLKDKTALVTGGAVRIGRAICEALAARGCHIIIHCNRSANEASELAVRLKGKGVKAVIVRGDLSSMEGCRKVITSAIKKSGNIDILVNNAAIFHKDSLMSATTGNFKKEMEVNFLAPAILTKEFANKIISQRKKNKVLTGKIINLLDRRITSMEAGCLPYLISKKNARGVYK
ncbi:MAG: SDR family NAD(P)-dependent oxidoreductase, partial [Kiritimatiellae bacterium]|nr:SDR family NAD(P)-dependent oxidoreductase [Kiritimatiellia bacterium]